jgi:hypothetical protein
MSLDSGRPFAGEVQWTRVPVDFQRMLERLHGALRAMGGRGIPRGGADDDPRLARVPTRGREWRLVHRHGDFAPLDQSAGSVE